MATPLFYREGTEFDPSTGRILSFNTKIGSGKAVRTLKCPRCGGAGGWAGWPGFTCFRCGGERFEHRTVSVYTAEKLAKLNASRDKQRAKADEKARAAAAVREAEQAAAVASRKDAFYAARGALLEAAAPYVERSSFLQNVVAKAHETCTLTERQVEAIVSAINQLKAEDAGIPCPSGTTVITGKIVSFRRVESVYGTTLKVLVVDDRGFKVWGTVPNEVGEAIGWDYDNSIRGVRVTFTATVQPSNDDPKFGFYSRPRKASVLQEVVP